MNAGPPEAHMKITVAKSAGFCFGVKRAIDMALDTAAHTQGRPVQMLGDIVHNERHGFLSFQLPTQDPLQIIEVRIGQAAVSFRVAGEDEELEALCGLFQDGEDSSEAAGVGGGEDVVQDEEPAVVSCQDLCEGEADGEVDLFGLSAGEVEEGDFR